VAKRPKLKRALAASGLAPRRITETPWPTNIFIHNLRKPLPFGRGSFRAVYASHVLEHMYLTEAQTLLRECFRVLEPGGIARIVVPDLKAHIMEYLGQGKVADPNEVFEVHTAADRFNRNVMLRPRQPQQGSLLYRLYTAATDLHSHKWMYDAESLSFHMGEAGFVEVVVCGALESRIEGIAAVENPKRVIGGHGVCVEGVKPLS
jgi:ubiquinone/menaquinone biosynthesis C-methylase UbiE